MPISPWLPVLTCALKDNLFHSHITIVTFLIWASKDNPFDSHITIVTFLVWASKDNPIHSHITMVTLLISASKDNPSFSPYHHGYLSSPWHQRKTWTQGCSRVLRGHQSVYSPRWPARSGCRCLGDRGQNWLPGYRSE